MGATKTATWSGRRSSEEDVNDEDVSEQNERAQRRRNKACHEEDENAGLGPKSTKDAVTMADAGLPRSGAATMTPATSGTETVPDDEQRVGHESPEVGE